MLSESEKREMLADARDKGRRDDFRAAEAKVGTCILSLDAYIDFLDSLQEIFGPFPVSEVPTRTEKNRL